MSNERYNTLIMYNTTTNNISESGKLKPSCHQKELEVLSSGTFFASEIFGQSMNVLILFMNVMFLLLIRRVIVFNYPIRLLLSYKMA